MRGEASLHGLADLDASEMIGAELWDWFSGQRARMIEAFRGLQPKERLAWLGPDIGGRSLATSRLLETWSHAHDLADTFEVAYPPTERLRHIAHIGFVTRSVEWMQIAQPWIEPNRISDQA